MLGEAVRRVSGREAWDPEGRGKLLLAEPTETRDEEELKELRAYQKVTDVNLTDHLIRLNGNYTFMTAADFERGNHDLMTAFNTWLIHQSPVGDPTKHVRTEGGRWITDAQARVYVSRGWSLHIPSRTLVRFKSVPTLMNNVPLSTPHPQTKEDPIKKEFEAS